MTVPKYTQKQERLESRTASELVKVTRPRGLVTEHVRQVASLVLDDGKGYVEVAAIEGVKPATVERWVYLVRDERRAGIRKVGVT